MLKKAGIALSSGCAKGIGASTGASTSATSRLRQQNDSFTRTSTTPPEVTGPRSYAVVADGHSRDAHHSSIPWPEVHSANAVPTPYEIFNQKKGSPYSKRRFYELVKIYHPDRLSQNSSCGDEISDTTKLERYRLIVAANNLLSDPSKRAAYDAYGTGWQGESDKAAQHGSWAQPYSGGGGPGGPRYNATWEDWEKWHNRNEKQEPIYFSNGVFAVLILLFGTIGFVGQNRVVDNFSSSLTHQIDALHRDMSQDLMRRRREASMNANKDERVHDFLRTREELAHGVTTPRREPTQKLLPPPDVRSSK
ncbi:J domain-containing protein 1 [Pseudogymnoascus australis]